MTRALIIIDYVNDFVADDGSLTCGKPAQVIDANIAKLAEEFAASGDLIVVANDTHRLNDSFNPESKFFPPHCITGTHGAEVYGQTAKAVEKIDTLKIEKSRYSCFAGTSLQLKLNERNIKELHLVGVCTDICVLHAAVDAYNKGYSIVVHKDCVASFDSDAHNWALKHMQNVLGAKIV